MGEYAARQNVEFLFCISPVHSSGKKKGDLERPSPTVVWITMISADVYTWL